MTLIRIQNRRGNASAWESADPTLEPGELGIESDTGKFKIGDGSTTWTTLPYAATRPSDLTNTVDDYVLLADVGTAGNPPSLNVDKNLIIPGASIVVEGSTDNTYETTLTVTNPTQDRTITFKDADGTVAFVSDLNSYILTSAIGGATGVAGLDSSSDLIVPGDAIIFEGSTANEYETTLQVTDPTADRSVTIPNASGTVITTGNLTDITSVGTLSSLTVSGDLTVNGTTTTLNSTTLSVDDKNIEIGSVDTPTDTTANGGGIVLKGATDKTILWSSDSGAWTSSEDIALSAGKTLIFEGATDNTYETKLTVVDPTGDRTITFPNETGTVAIESWVSDALGAYVTTASVGSSVASLTGGKLSSAEIPTSLATTTYANSAASAAQQAAEATAAGALSSHEGDTTNIHGITDTAALATKAGTETFTNKTLTSPKINEDVAVTATATEINTLDGITASTSELNILDGVTADYTEINILDGATLSTTELNYVDGVTSAIQTQINNKAPLDSPTFTGTVTLPNNTISQSMMGDDAVGTNEIGGLAVTEAKIADGAVTNVKVSASAAIAQSKIDGLTTDLAAKAPLASPTFTGTVTTDDLIVDGDFTVNGTNFSASATSITIEDNLVQLAHQNAGNTVDLGIVVGYNESSTAKHSGIVRDVSADKWKLFKGVTTEPSTTVDFTQGSLDDLELAGLTATSATIGDVSNTELQYLNGVTSAIQTQLDGKQATVANVSDTEIGYLDGVTSAIQTQINAKTPELYTFTTDSGTSRTLALADNFASLRFTSSSAITVTVPTNSAVAFPVGSYVELYQFGTAQITVTQSAGVTVNATDSQKKSRVQYSSLTLIKVNTDEWLLVGDTAA